MNILLLGWVVFPGSLKLEKVYGKVRVECNVQRSLFWLTTLVVGLSVGISYKIKSEVYSSQ